MLVLTEFIFTHLFKLALHNTEAANKVDGVVFVQSINKPSALYGMIFSQYRIGLISIKSR
jgi:hypothetical protein